MARFTTPEDPDAWTETRLRIDGMHCLSCVLRIESALEEVPGVSSASADLAEQAATVRHRPGAATHADLARAVAMVGYRIAPPPDGYEPDG